jgi:hypothetical protein
MTDYMANIEDSQPQLELDDEELDGKNTSKK